MAPDNPRQPLNKALFSNQVVPVLWYLDDCLGYLIRYSEWIVQSIIFIPLPLKVKFWPGVSWIEHPTEECNV